MQNKPADLLTDRLCTL